jgi:hypothetical protein
MGASAVVGTRGSGVCCQHGNSDGHESHSDFLYAKDENLLRAQSSIYSLNLALDSRRVAII